MKLRTNSATRSVYNPANDAAVVLSPAEYEIFWRVFRKIDLPLPDGYSDRVVVAQTLARLRAKLHRIGATITPAREGSRRVVPL